ncbi:phosphoadenosine phosphosulfate reductase family protein, partial [Rhizobacter sp. Root29]|uniref:phosphoadenosine phosphosulfate reductase domain-containing protein n=2 Tax=unclassified Rhizobacter TaxID=2640088 RepID=UPI0012FA0DBB
MKRHDDPSLCDLVAVLPDEAAAGGPLERERPRSRAVPERVTAHLDQSHLDWLEEEAIFILRETVAAFERPALLFSGGKDSCVVLRLAEKAFKTKGADGEFKGRLPFPLLHVDTGHNFPEVIEFRDRRIAEMGERLVVGHLEDSI